MTKKSTWGAVAVAGALFFFLAAQAVFAGDASGQGAPVWTPRTAGLLALQYPAQPKAVLDAFLGIPYRDDGAVDAGGRFTLFAAPEVTFDTPGLNCSGFVLAASRLLLLEPISLDQAKHDRLGDSGPGASMGQDWDFGWDFVLNVTQGRSPRLLTPEGQLPLPLAQADGRSLRGFDLLDAGAWSAALAHLKPGQLAFLSMSKPWDKNGYTLLHHHVALILPTADGGRWYYHAVGKGGVTRSALHDPESLRGLLAKYPATPLGERGALLLVVDLPV